MTDFLLNSWTPDAWLRTNCSSRHHQLIITVRDLPVENISYEAGAERFSLMFKIYFKILDCGSDH